MIGVLISSMVTSKVCMNCRELFFFMNEAPMISDEHECGHLYACLVALGIDTAGLERD